MAINIAEEIKKSKKLDSFHIFSEKYMRGQIFKFKAGRELNDYSLKDENLLIIVFEGHIKVQIKDKPEESLTRGMQILIKEHGVFSVMVQEDSVLEYIWCPGMYRG